MQHGNLGWEDDHGEELIGGELVARPHTTLNHSRIVGNLYCISGDYLDAKSGEAFIGSINLYLSENDRFVPDLVVVCDPTKIKINGVHGAPDLVAEVLSPSTCERDRTTKMDTYARAGVDEYWIIDPVDRSIEQYLLANASYTLRNVYRLYPDSELDSVSDKQKAGTRTYFRCHLFDDLDISVQQIFKRTT